MKRNILFFISVLFVVTSVYAVKSGYNIEFTKFELDNGLRVIFHIDKSDPVVAVALTCHVGSSRELPGRTGFAHLFEHLLFLESENLGKGGLDKLSAKIGGSGANGSTSRDRTNYFQTVPNDALEKMIWAEADKLGYFINTVTNPVLSKEKEIVKNEIRQHVGNQPYGYTQYIIDKNLYPKGHPYSWQVLGTLEDVQNATLQDVRDFFHKWYVPNNVILTISGNFDPIQAKKWVKKYFNDIKQGKVIKQQKKMPAKLKKTKKLYHLDSFARHPELSLTWPSQYRHHPDSYPLQVLASLLSEGKKAPLNQIIVEKMKLSSNVFVRDYTSELAGQFMIRIRGFENTKLDDIKKGIDDAFAVFEKKGAKEEDLSRIKAMQETLFYQNISSVLGKGFQLAQYEIYAGDPGFINSDIQKILSVTKEDVFRVYKKYIKNKPYVATSFVPKNKKELALSGSVKANITEEKIVKSSEKSFDLSKTSSFKKSFSSFDRSIEPPYGRLTDTEELKIWEKTLPNGLNLIGAESTELPLVHFNLVINGGMLQDNIKKVGIANLVASMMNKGTKSKTTVELEDALKLLGARLHIQATNESIVLSGICLKKNFNKTLSLAYEMLTAPRWDVNEFKLLKKKIMNRIRQQSVRPNAIATNIFRSLIYGKNHILSKNILGNLKTIQSASLDDLKSFYNTNISPSISTFHVVGAIKKDAVLQLLTSLNTDWKKKEIVLKKYKLPKKMKKSQLYFYNIPNAKQSVLRFGYLAMPFNDKDFYPAHVMNYILGGGGFASDLMQVLREQKGYTYGVYSGFSGTNIPGPFTIGSSVRTNSTYDATRLIVDILRNYKKNYTQNDHKVTQNYLLKSNARSLETLSAKLRILNNISKYKLPYNYMNLRKKTVTSLSRNQIQELSKRYLNPDRMIYLFVGDAKTQLKDLEKLGFGSPILLNK